MKHLEKLPLGLLTLFTIKLMILNSWSYESAAVLLALAGVVSLFQYTAKNKQIEALRTDINAHNKQFEDMKKEIEQLRSHVSGLKLASGMKPQSQPRSF